MDAVDDLGWDPSGAEPITDSLDEHLQDGTLIEVPSGEYLVDSRCDARNLQNWGLRGTGDSHEDVRIVVPKGSVQRILNIRGNSRNILVENLTFDQFDTWATSIGNILQVADGLLVKDVEYAGKNPSETTGATSHLNVYVLDPDGEAVLDGLTIAGPTELIDYPENTLTVFSGKESKGTITIQNSHFENCGEHAIYASRCEGAVRIDNCYFKNNQNTHARISGEGSWVRDSTFVWDLEDHPNRGEFQGQTGMTFESGFRGYTGGLAENCEFICKSSGPNSGCLKVDGSHGGITVRSCTFDVDADGAEPIWADAPGNSHMIDGVPDGPHAIHLEGVTITGSGAGTHGNDAAVELQGRDGSTLAWVDVDVDARDGLRLTDGTYYLQGCSLEPGEGRQAVTGNGAIRRPADSVTDLSHHLLVKGTEATTRYEIDVSDRAGLVATDEHAATPSDGSTGETVTQHDDGTRAIAGIVAAGGGDTFRFDGEIVDVRVLEGADPEVLVDGTVVDLT